jgi:hypothetical protein
MKIGTRSLFSIKLHLARAYRTPVDRGNRALFSPWNGLISTGAKERVVADAVSPVPAWSASGQGPPSVRPTLPPSPPLLPLSTSPPAHLVSHDSRTRVLEDVRSSLAAGL